MTNAKSWFDEKLEEYKNDPEFVFEEVLLEVNHELYEAMQSTGITKKELAEKLGRSPAYITRLLDGQQNLTVKTLVFAAHALGYRFRPCFSHRLELTSNMLELEPVYARTLKKSKLSTLNTGPYKAHHGVDATMSESLEKIAA